MGHDGVCQRCQVDRQNNEAFLFNISRHNGIPSILQTFEILFPKVYVEEVIIRETNKRIQENKLTYGEFLIWIGLWFFMRTTHFGNQREFWSTKAIDAFEGTPFSSNDYMSRNRFENILAAFSITNRRPPAFCDRFWEVHQIIKAWKDNIRMKFSTTFKRASSKQVPITILVTENKKIEENQSTRPLLTFVA